MVSTWLTLAPALIAIFTAVASCPFSCPTTRSRIFYSPSDRAPSGRAVAVLDDFRHGHAQPLVDDHDLAARHQAVVHIDVDRLADLAVEFEHAALPELKQLGDREAGAAEHGGDVHRHVEHRRQV